MEAWIVEHKEFIDSVWKKLDQKLSRTAIKSRNKIPYTTVNGVHDDRQIYPLQWTNGFWGGLMWLMYIGTQNEEYRTTAEIAEKLMDRAFQHMEEWHHDVGFMWHITSGVNYRLTGNSDSKNRNLLAAMTLMSRYNVEGNFIRCWNSYREDTDVAGWTIIDCMMNIPILYWASRELGDPRFSMVAIRHADMSVRDHVREDGSIRHIVIHDTTKADTVLGFNKGQGYSEDSCWSRGAAWALYGFTLSYIHTKHEQYLATATRVADYFIQQCEVTDWLPRVDFCQPETPALYDSTAGAIASCGLIELARLTGDKKYFDAAIAMLKAMEKAWCNWGEEEDSILGEGRVAYSFGENEPIIYGDYFLTEAILKLRGCTFLPW